MLTTTFGIQHKTTGLYFGGFNPDHSVKWVSKREAMPMKKEAAESQAYLLSRFDVDVKREPVSVVA